MRCCFRVACEGIECRSAHGKSPRINATIIPRIYRSGHYGVQWFFRREARNKSRRGVLRGVPRVKSDWRAKSRGAGSRRKGFACRVHHRTGGSKSRCLSGPHRGVGAGESSNGRTADSDSACLGSNPSSPAKQNQQLKPVLASRTRGPLRTGCSPSQFVTS